MQPELVLRAVGPAVDGGRLDLATIVGRLHEGDFAPLALRCRVDTIDVTIPCSFTVEMRDTVLGAMDAMVIATGVAALQPDGRIRSLDLEDLTTIDEAQRKTVDQLAEDRGIVPVQDIAEFATLTDIDSNDFDHFVRSAMSARS